MSEPNVPAPVPAKPDRTRTFLILAALLGGGYYLNAHPEVLRPAAPKVAGQQMAHEVESDPREVARQLEQEAERLVQETLLDDRAALQAEFRQIDRDLREGILQLQRQASERRKEAAARQGMKGK